MRDGSLSQAGWRQQLMVVFALMTVIPFMTFGYFMVIYLLPLSATQESILLVVGLNFLLSITGLMLLGRIFRSMMRLRDYLRVVAAGDLSQPFPVSEGPEFIEIAGSLQRIVRTLRNDRDHAMAFADRIEQEVSKRMTDLQDANVRLSVAIERLTNMHERLGGPEKKPEDPEAVKA
ncbi:MAG: hypothetical protein A2498_05650 [Lentisphaerae bacterium RIFOXYC12_FULL_60_16]|nr:MAG: hypothetical protein A2498_05650 [Lentisphaerae bacterium RIFOXYC12_FULL_60_16]